MTIPANDLSWAINVIYDIGDNVELVQSAERDNIRYFLTCLSPLVSRTGITAPVRKACLVLWPLLGGNTCDPTYVRYWRELRQEGWSGDDLHAALKEKGVRFHKREPAKPILQPDGSWKYPVQIEEAEEFINRSIATPSKEDIMKAFETISYVYGNNITTLTQEQLIAYIKKAEGEKTALDGVKTPSKKIKAMQADLDTAIAKMVEALDAL